MELTSAIGAISTVEDAEMPKTSGAAIRSPVFEVRELEVHFRAGTGDTMLRAVDKVSFQVHRGETFGIIGESGSGKSTLARALTYLTKPTRGQILQDGIDPLNLGPRELRSHRRRFQLIFQNPDSALNPRRSILSSVVEPLEIVRGQRTVELEGLALQALEKVGLRSEFALRYPHQLSGGQKQRVNIARALVMQPAALVCDEIVSALDVSIRAEVLNLLIGIQAELGLTVVFITHDLSVVSHVSDRIAVMYLGQIVELADAAELRGRPLHPYTRALWSAEPQLSRSVTEGVHHRVTLQGEIPSPVTPPSGCRFRTRCPHAREICVEKMPLLREPAPGHQVACHFDLEYPDLFTDGNARLATQP